jgi:uncharacterized protein (DUF2147 family)
VQVRTAAIILVLVGATAAAPADINGKWRNPAHSVIIRARPCGIAICGTVVWANDKAKADAAKGGNKQLVGMQLLQSFAPDGPNKWHGRVYVPDIDKTVSGTMELSSHTTLDVKGCALGGIACKSQQWTRVS